MADRNNVRTSTSCSTRSATVRDHAEAYETPKKKTRKATSSGEPDDARAVSEAANNPPSDMGVLKSPMSALTKMVNESIAPTVWDMKRAYDAAAAHANMAAEKDALDSEESECEASEDGEVTDEPEKAKSTHGSCSNDGKHPRGQQEYPNISRHKSEDGWYCQQDSQWGTRFEHEKVECRQICQTSKHATTPSAKGERCDMGECWLQQMSDGHSYPQKYWNFMRGLTPMVSSHTPLATPLTKAAHCLLQRNSGKSWRTPPYCWRQHYVM